MNFTSLEFLVFFPVVFALYWLLPGKMRWLLLLIASYLFYINWNPWTGLLLLSSTALSYVSAGKIADTEKSAQKKAWLAVSVIFCLGCLVLFKGDNFLVAGISFYTFQTLSYVLDVYRGRTECERNFGWYALFVSFFPQLVAGPIERMENLLPQLKKVQAWSRQSTADGLWLMLRGFFKKIVAADYLAGFVNIIYESPGEAGGLGAVLGTVFFAIQIYCDFSGYTDIARGAACMLGIRLTENFDHPYRAANIRDFWRRWHISLTKWFTDYVYIPLGGSKKGLFCHCMNILLVFLLSGLWHGLSLNFVVWGLFHGALLVGYTLIKGRSGKVPETMTGCKKNLSCAGTFFLVCFAWIFFRAETLWDAKVLIGQIAFHFADQGIAGTLRFMEMGTVDFVRLLLVFLCLRLTESLPETLQGVKTDRQAAEMIFTGFFMILAIGLSWLSELAANGGNVFLYFKF